MSAPAPNSNATGGKSIEELKGEWHVAEKQKLKTFSTGMASDAERAVANGTRDLHHTLLEGFLVPLVQRSALMTSGNILSRCGGMHLMCSIGVP